MHQVQSIVVSLKRYDGKERKLSAATHFILDSNWRWLSLNLQKPLNVKAVKIGKLTSSSNIYQIQTKHILQTPNSQIPKSA